MKCPTCNSWTAILETRKRADGAKYRRYECRNNHRFSTLESVMTPTGRSSTSGEKASSGSTERLDHLIASPI